MLKRVPFVTLLSVALTLFSQNTMHFPKPLLRGISSLEIHSSCEATAPLPFSCTTLENTLELKLRLAGVPIRAGGASLWIAVSAMTVRQGGQSLGWAAATSLTVIDRVASTRDPAVQDGAIVWTGSNLSVGPNLGESVRSSASELMDGFLNVFLEQNPK